MTNVMTETCPLVTRLPLEHRHTQHFEGRVASGALMVDAHNDTESRACALRRCLSPAKRSRSSVGDFFLIESYEMWIPLGMK